MCELAGRGGSAGCAILAVTGDRGEWVTPRKVSYAEKSPWERGGYQSRSMMLEGWGLVASVASGDRGCAARGSVEISRPAYHRFSEGD